jgi:hypothetical protein
MEIGWTCAQSIEKLYEDFTRAEAEAGVRPQ